MADIPDSIDDVGPVTVKPLANPAFDVNGASLSAEDFFVLSRMDGSCTLRELIMMTGLGNQRTIDIVVKLRRCGAFMVGSETAADVMKFARPSDEVSQSAPAEEKQDIAYTEEEAAALAEDVSLSKAERRRIIAVARIVRSGDYFALLGVGRDADKRSMKKAYFKMSKEFHPDRYYGKNTGSFGPWLSDIFEGSTRAFEILRDDDLRAELAARLDGTTVARRAQTREEHAASLFEQACQLEVSGDAKQAVMLFGGACRIDPQPRYLRRAAACALAGGVLDKAEQFVKQARDVEPENQSVFRLQAGVYRAQGRLEDAVEVLEAGLNVKSENDSLVGELQSDLEQLKRELNDS